MHGRLLTGSPTHHRIMAPHRRLLPGSSTRHRRLTPHRRLLPGSSTRHRGLTPHRRLLHRSSTHHRESCISGGVVAPPQITYKSPHDVTTSSSSTWTFYVSPHVATISPIATDVDDVGANDNHRQPELALWTTQGTKAKTITDDDRRW
jgi:hypothetical protein